VKRLEFNSIMAQKTQQAEEDKRVAKEAKLDKENQLIRELRNKPIAEGGCTFKATPVLKEDPYPLTNKVTRMPLTTPLSPALLTRSRARAASGIVTSH
jgi:hypothetical protein